MDILPQSIWQGVSTPHCFPKMEAVCNFAENPSNLVREGFQKVSVKQITALFGNFRQVLNQSICGIFEKGRH